MPEVGEGEAMIFPLAGAAIVSTIRAEQDAERERKRAECSHEWDHAPFVGVVVGLTQCKRCGTPCRSADFQAATKAKP